MGMAKAEEKKGKRPDREKEMDLELVKDAPPARAITLRGQKGPLVVQYRSTPYGAPRELIALHPGGAMKMTVYRRGSPATPAVGKMHQVPAHERGKEPTRAELVAEVRRQLRAGKDPAAIAKTVASAAEGHALMRALRMHTPVKRDFRVVDSRTVDMKDVLTRANEAIAEANAKREARRPKNVVKRVFKGAWNKLRRKRSR